MPMRGKHRCTSTSGQTPQIMEGKEKKRKEKKEDNDEKKDMVTISGLKSWCDSTSVTYMLGPGENIMYHDTFSQSTIRITSEFCWVCLTKHQHDNLQTYYEKFIHF